MKLLGKIVETMKMNMKTTLAYAASAWAGIAVNIMQIIIFYYIWSAVYGGNESIHGISKGQIITYVILSRVLFMQILWGVNLWIAQLIYTGEISIFLLRPIDFQLLMYSSRLGEFVSSMVLNGGPVLVVSLILFKISPPFSMVNGGMFVISILLAVTLAFLMEFITGIISFYTTNGWGTQVLKEAIMYFFSGALIPIDFFPGWLKVLTNILPFKNLVYTPISIYLGLVQGQALVEALLFQGIWVVALFVLSRVFYNISIKKVTVQGG